MFLVNEHILKVYFQPHTKVDFMQQVQQPFEKELVAGNTNLLKNWFLLVLTKKKIIKENKKKKWQK